MDTSREERRRQMEQASRRADEAAAELLHQSLQVLYDEVARLDEVRPQTADDETYNSLIAAVQDATARNQSIAELVNRVKALGEGAVALVKELATAAVRLT